MHETAIGDKLIKVGQTWFDAPKEFGRYTRVSEADILLNDLDQHPHAFVIACLMDRQVKYERAWLIPHTISQRLGGFSIKLLARLSRSDIRELMSSPAPLHRFAEIMSGVFEAAVRRICDVYSGDASHIWTGEPSSAESVYRFLQFKGAGPKIATMAVNTLARDFKIKFSDYYSIDISADTHVKRVFTRLGLCQSDPSGEQVIYKARALSPNFPGMIDYPCWEIGTNWCRPQNPLCGSCYMNTLCPTAKVVNSRP